VVVLVIGYVILLILAALIYLGLGHRVLDRLGLTDKSALGFIVAMIIGTFINIPLSRGPQVLAINLGGIIPIILAIYVLTKASGKEVTRALLATAITTGIIFAISKSFTFEEGNTPIDPTYLWAIISAAVAYLIGRSRRAAFISAILSINLMDIINFALQVSQGAVGTTHIGGAGILDASLIAGFLAVGLAELVGETNERIHGGHHKEAENHKGKDKNLENLEYATALLDFEDLKDFEEITRESYHFSRAQYEQCGKRGDYSE